MLAVCWENYLGCASAGSISVDMSGGSTPTHAYHRARKEVSSVIASHLDGKRESLSYLPFSTVYRRDPLFSLLSMGGGYLK